MFVSFQIITTYNHIYSNMTRFCMHFQYFFFKVQFNTDVFVRNPSSPIVVMEDDFCVFLGEDI